MEFVGETSRESSSTNIFESRETGAGIDSDSAPVLFLDVDGVLTTSRGLLMTYAADDASSLYHIADLVPGAVPDSVPPLEKDRVANLLAVLTAVPELRIVISSTWREDAEYLAFLLAALRKGGIDVDTVVIDQTPVLSRGRGAEVREWLAFHPSHEVYGIVDDGHVDSFNEYGFGPDLVQTYIGCSRDEYEGLTHEHAMSLVELFHNKGRHVDIECALPVEPAEGERTGAEAMEPSSV